MSVEKQSIFCGKNELPVQNSQRRRRFPHPWTRIQQIFPFVSQLRGRHYGEIDSFHKPTTTVPRQYSDERKREIVDGLVFLCRRGKLGGVWWGVDEPLRIRFVLTGEPEFITWREASELLDKSASLERMAPRKPPARVVSISGGRPPRKSIQRAVNAK